MDARVKPGHDGCFCVALFKAQLLDLAARPVRVLPEVSAPEKSEGAGNAGCPMHPQPRVRNKTKHTSIVTTGTPESSRHSPRNGFTAYSVLSPATNSSCHRHPRIKGLSKPGRAHAPPRI